MLFNTIKKLDKQRLFTDKGIKLFRNNASAHKADAFSDYFGGE